MKLLLRARACSEKRDSRGLTALWVASQKGHGEVVRLLLDAGATDQANNLGQSASWCLLSSIFPLVLGFGVSYFNTFFFMEPL